MDLEKKHMSWLNQISHMLFISISERNFHRYSTIHPAFTEHVIDLTGNPNLSIKKNLGGLLAAH
jgi:hypothetical protein